MIAVAPPPAHAARTNKNFWTIAELPQPQICFVPGTPPNDIDAVMRQMPWYNGGLSGPRFNQVSRWSVTATDGGTGNEGDPITLTYSFPPDGTTIPQLLSGFPSRPNDFNAWMNGIYGSQAVWQPIYDEVFVRWSELTGISYTFEPNDDGVNLNQNPGILGVRGDVRIAGMLLDGNSGTLAYNNFPDDGDMLWAAVSAASAACTIGSGGITVRRTRDDRVTVRGDLVVRLSTFASRCKRSLISRVVRVISANSRSNASRVGASGPLEALSPSASLIAIV